jgi:hypothetical protein
MDMQMMLVYNAREREMADWEKVIAGGDSRLKIRSCKTPLGSAQSILEIGFES